MNGLDVMTVPGTVHRLEVYRADLEGTTEFWGWFLGKLEYGQYQEWPNGRSYRLGQTHLVRADGTAVCGQFLPSLQARSQPSGLSRGVSLPGRRNTVLLRGRGMRITYEDRHPHACGPQTYAV